MSVSTLPEASGRLKATLTSNNRSYGAFIVQLGEGHLQVSTVYQFTTGNLIHLECELLPGRQLVAEGRVVGSTEQTVGDIKNYSLRISLEGLNPYAQVVIREYLGHKADRRKSGRHVMNVPAALLQPTRMSGLSIVNGGEDGLFLPTSVPIPANTFLRLEIRLPGHPALTADARSVHLIDYSRALAIKRQSGVGVEIVNLQKSERKAWQTFLAGLAGPHPAAPTNGEAHGSSSH